jgi:hypothetical protein
LSFVALATLATASTSSGEDEFPLVGTYTENQPCKANGSDVGSKDDIKPGAHVFIVAATKQPDGSLTTPAMYVGRDGVVPPM